MRGRRRATLIVAALVLVVAAGCGEQSRVAPDQIVSVSGTVTAGGDPAAGRPVQLGVGVTPADGAFAVLTVGLHCSSGACSGKIQDTRPDARGNFRFELEGRDTQSSFGEAEPVLVSARGEPADEEVSGPLTSARFRIQTADVQLPPLELVDARLVVEDAGAVVARWEPAEPGPYELSFEIDEARPVWRTRTVDTATSVDPRFLEDTAGRVVVSGGAEDAVEGSTVALAWRSGGVAYAAGAGAPPSRGRACRYVGPSGAASPDDHDCGLTDGDLVSPAPSGAVCVDEARQQCEIPASAVVDLGVAVPAELVVVRGCDGGCAVDVSADGAAYRPVASAGEGFGAVPLDGAPIRFVRVGLGGSPTDLREVSVWGPVPRRALVAVDSEDRAAIGQPYRPADDSHGNDLPLVPVLVAFAAVVVAAAGAAFAAGRRIGSGQGVSP